MRKKESEGNILEGRGGENKERGANVKARKGRKGGREEVRLGEMRVGRGMERGKKRERKK